KTQAGGTNTFTYDSLYRLVGATHPTGEPAESYGYDAVGNRTVSALSSAYVYDVANRLTADASFDYAYDANGNLVRKTERATARVTSYSYDTDNRLIGITTPQRDVISYRYDGLGRRVAKIVNSVATQYVYDSSNILFEYTGSGAQAARYTNDPQIDE